MKHILTWSYLGQHRIAHLGSVRLSEYDFVTAIFQEGAHTHSPYTQCHMMPIGNQRHYLL